LDIVQKIWALLGKLFAPPGVPSWLRAWFREWLPGVPPKQTEISWDESRNHSSMRL